MKWLKLIVAQLFALFIDDGRYAVAIVAWVTVQWLLLPHLALPDAWRAPLLAAGLLAILLDGVVRRARRTG